MFGRSFPASLPVVVIASCDQFVTPCIEVVSLYVAMMQINNNNNDKQTGVSGLSVTWYHLFCLAAASNSAVYTCIKRTLSLSSINQSIVERSLIYINQARCCLI